MMKKLPPVPELPANNGTAQTVEEAEEEDDDESSEDTPPMEEPPRNAVVENVHEVHVNANAGPIAVSFSAGFRLATRAHPAPAAAIPHTHPEPPVQAVQAVVETGGAPQVRPVVQPPVQPPSSDFGLTILAIALMVAIVALFIKKLMKSSGSPEVGPSQM